MVLPAPFSDGWEAGEPFEYRPGIVHQSSDARPTVYTIVELWRIAESVKKFLATRESTKASGNASRGRVRKRFGAA